MKTAANFPLQELPFAGASLAQLAGMPKIDLHRHLVGSIRPEVLVHIARAQAVEVPTFGNDAERIRNASVLTSPVASGYKKFLGKRIWSAFQPIFRTQRGTANAMYWAIADAHNDNVVYVEFRVSPYGIEPNFPLTLSEFLDGLRVGISAAQRDFPGTIARVLLSIGRRSICSKWPVQDHAGYIDRLLEAAESHSDFVVGFDFSGDEDRFPNHLLVDCAKAIKGHGFKLSVHAGETGRPESVRQAVDLLRADRVGHGIAAYRDPALARFLADRQVPIEICPTSNVLLGVVTGWSDHDIKRLLDVGVLVTINTDDPVLFGGTTLSLELYQLLVHNRIAMSHLPALLQNALDASFACEADRAALRVMVNEPQPTSPVD